MWPRIRRRTRFAGDARDNFGDHRGKPDASQDRIAQQSAHGCQRIAQAIGAGAPLNLLAK
jgi:hypothetical protein